MRGLCESAKKGHVCPDDICRGSDVTLCGFDKDLFDALMLEDDEDWFHQDDEGIPASAVSGAEGVVANTEAAARISDGPPDTSSEEWRLQCEAQFVADHDAQWREGYLAGVEIKRSKLAAQMLRVKVGEILRASER